MFLNKTINDITFYQIDYYRVAVWYGAIVSTGDYDLALKIAKKFGGRKFHNKKFGGGIAFYKCFGDKTGLESLANQINNNKLKLKI